MPSINPLCITVLILVCYSGYSLAFGAGSVPQYPILQGRAFRHGDLEELLAEMLIRTADVGTNLVGFATKEIGKRFSIINIKRTYFGNWLFLPRSLRRAKSLDEIIRKSLMSVRYQEALIVPFFVSWSGFSGSCNSAMQLKNLKSFFSS